MLYKVDIPSSPLLLWVSKSRDSPHITVGMPPLSPNHLSDGYLGNAYLPNTEVGMHVRVNS